jgi:hypothetical protein
MGVVENLVMGTGILIYEDLPFELPAEISDFLHQDSSGNGPKAIFFEQHDLLEKIGYSS